MRTVQQRVKGGVKERGIEVKVERMILKVIERGFSGGLEKY